MGDIPLNPNVQTNLKTLPNLIDNVVNNFIVKPPGNTIGISGFVFDIVGTEEITLESDITDHWLEDNTSIQDHVALRPEHFTLSGYQGELRDIFQNSFLSILTTVQSFGTVFGLAPSFSTQATQVYNKISSVASKVGNVLNQAQNIFDVFAGNSTTANRQQAAFQYFYNLWLSRQLCQIETPYGILNDMAIEHVRAKQDESTRLVTDFSVTFKKIRKAKTIQTITEQNAVNVAAIVKTAAVGRAAQVLASVSVVSGTTAGKVVDGSKVNQVITSLK